MKAQGKVGRGSDSQKSDWGGAARSERNASNARAYSPLPFSTSRVICAVRKLLPRSAMHVVFDIKERGLLDGPESSASQERLQKKGFGSKVDDIARER